MQSPEGIDRVILVVLDGLRADAIQRLPLPGLARLATLGAYTDQARTVEPSITTAALTSLMTGVSPNIHRVRSDAIGLPRPMAALTPLPQLLRTQGLSVSGFMASLPRGFRGLGGQLAAHLGATVVFEGATSEAILDRALPTLELRRRGLTFLHWPEADVTGHRHGWMTAEYGASARRVDEALERLVQCTGVLDDPAAVLIALADHGGGGASSHDHNSTHPHDTTIPLLMLGGQIAPIELAPGASLLDLPATIAWLFGITPPPTYQGRVLGEVVRRPSRDADSTLARSPREVAA